MLFFVERDDVPKFGLRPNDVGKWCVVVRGRGFVFHDEETAVEILRTMGRSRKISYTRRHCDV
jgi:hypothetical protein